MARRVPWRLIAVGAAALLLVLVIVGIARTLNEPRPLTTAQFEKLTRSGTLAGVANTLTSEPASPGVSLAQQSASYLGVDACTQYFRSAENRLLLQSSSVAVNPTDDLVTGVDVELWTDQYSAATAITQWSACLQAYQQAQKTSAPLKVTAQGASGAVTWQFWHNVSADSPVNLLVLRDRNVIATFQVPEEPEADWREQLIKRFDGDIAKAQRS